MEIERKFLVVHPPRDLARHPAERIEQGYLAVDGEGIEVRVRRCAGRSTMTVKQGLGLVRLEEELKIGRARFERLWPLTQGRRVEKVRHLVPEDGVTLELDVYGGRLAGLIVAEIEFDSLQASAAYQPPDWLGGEVTGDERYANRTLASDGWPTAKPPFQLPDDESVTTGLRRIARARLDKAVGGLDATGPDGLGEAVHSARKSLKRLRTTLRLARDGLGDEVYRRENAALRDAGRRLSGSRDSQVMVETLDALRARYCDELAPESFAQLRKTLVKEHEAAHARLRQDAGTVSAVVEQLRDARTRTDEWTTEGEEIASFAPGLRRIYRRGRRALRAVDEQPGDEALHDLRKRVKDLWYASELIRPAHPKRAKKIAARASRLSDLIGEDRDLAVLRATVERHRARLTDPEFTTLVELIERRRAKLQDRARTSAHRLYRRKPGATLRRLGLNASRA